MGSQGEDVVPPHGDKEEITVLVTGFGVCLSPQTPRVLFSFGSENQITPFNIK
jgi:hypothetical protein